MFHRLNSRSRLKVCQRIIVCALPFCRIFIAALLLSDMWILAAAASEQLTAAKATEAITNCRQGSSNADIAACYEKVLSQLKENVRHAQNKRITELNELLAKRYGGSRNVLRFQQAAREVDIQWKALIANECGPLIEAEFYGGQGQGLFAQLCQINLLAARLDSLTAARR
jgi:hypothetical protein